MFSATKFVVAAAIVALFGGFLLSGILKQQPSDEPLPPAAASASSPDATTAPKQTVRSDLLPGVDLVVEAVEPGVYRVISDGVRDLSEPLQRYDYAAWRYRVVLTDDGRIGIADQFWKPPRQRFGLTETDVGYLLGDDNDLTGADEIGWAFSQDPRAGTGPSSPERQTPEGTVLYASDVSSDGTLWGVEWDVERWQARGVSAPVVLHRRSGEEWTSFDGGEEITHLPGDALPAPLRVGVDGSVWLTPGPAWDLALGILGEPQGEPPVPGEPYDIGCGGLKHFDSEHWLTFLDGVCIFDLAVTEQGDVWARGATMVLDDGIDFSTVRDTVVDTYVITPEAVAAAE